MTNRLVILVNGTSASIEAVRARELARNRNPEDTLILHRETSRGASADLWHRRINEFRPELLYVINTALPGIGVALRRRTQHGVPYVLDTGDAVFEMARSAGIDPWWRWPLLWAGERVAQRCASHVVVRGSQHRNMLEAQGFRHVSVIRDGFVKHPEVDPGGILALRARLGLKDAFVMGVMGSLVFSPRLGICYGWDLVQALALLRNLPVKGLVIGDGPGRCWLEAQARQHGVADRIVFTGRVDYSQVPVHLQLMDVALSTQTNNIAGQVRTTGKLPEYMAAGRFILASRVGEAALVLPDAMLLDYEGAVDATYPSRLAARIRHLLANPAEMDVRAALPAQAEAWFSYDVLGRAFDQVVDAAVRG